MRHEAGREARSYQSSVPAKEEARKFASGALCPKFAERDEVKAQFQVSNLKHNVFLYQVLGLLEEILGQKHNTKCVRREDVALERAVPDAVLECGQAIYVVEVKSYPFAEIDESSYCTRGYLRPYTADFEQAVAYKRRLQKSGVVPVLVYREVPLKQLRGKPLIIFIDEDADQTHPVFRREMYKPGPECSACSREDCPIRDKVQQYLSKSAAQPKVSSDIEVYQRLVIAEWCLARHGTRCVKCGPLYFAISQMTMHRDDLPLAEQHIDYIAGNNAQLKQSLFSNKLLVEKDCEKYKKALGKLVDKGKYLVAEGVTRDDFLIMLEYISLLYAIEKQGASVPPAALSGPEKCYRTFHGEVARLVRNVSALPGYRRTYEAYFLPIIVDYIGDRDQNLHMLLSSIQQKNTNQNPVWKKLSLLAKSLRNEKGSPVDKISEFQKEALDGVMGALADWLSGRSQTPFILITAPPGTGKTLVFLIVALALALRGEKAVIMYPTKKLAVQQVQQIFYTLEELNRHLSKPITLAVLDGDSKRCTSGSQSSKPSSVRSLRCSGGSGDLMYQDGQYVCVSNQVSYAVDWFADCRDSALDSDIIITNPYMLSSLLLGGTSNAKRLAQRLRLIVIDEVHTMLEPERLDFLTALMHNLILLGDLEEYPALLLSSATVTSSGLPLSNLATGASPAPITFRSIGVMERVEPPDPSAIGNFIDSLREAVLGKGLAQSYVSVPVDYYSLYGQQSPSGTTKLMAPMVIFTNPSESPSGTVQQAAVSLMLASESRRLAGVSLMNRFSSVIFFDSKEVLSEVERYVRERLVLHEGSPADKTLTKPLISSPSIKGGHAGRQVVASVLSHNQRSDLEDFSHLPLFCTELSDLNTAYSIASQIYNNPQSKPQPQGCYKSALDAATKIIDDIYKNRNVQQDIHKRSTLLIHHAELPQPLRYAVERKLEDPGQWSVVLSTSTLELGVNLEGVGAVAQYGLPRLAENVIQRFGRGGRDKSTLYTSLGFLFARHTGEDVALIDEDYATVKLFAFSRGNLQSRTDDRIVSIEMLVAYTAYSSLNNPQQVDKNVHQSAQFLGAQHLLPSIQGRIRSMMRAIQQIRLLTNTKAYRKTLRDLAKDISDDIEDLHKESLGILSGLSNNNISQYIQQKIQEIQSYAKDPVRYKWELYFIVDDLVKYVEQLPLPMNLIANFYNALKNLKDSLLNAILQYFPTQQSSGLEEKVLQLTFAPPMPDPRVVETTIDLYTVNRDGVSQRGVGLREAYLRASPMKTDRYEGI